MPKVPKASNSKSKAYSKSGTSAKSKMTAESRGAKKSDDRETWIPALVKVGKDQHLSDSRNTPGAKSSLLRDGDNNLKGPAEIRLVDEVSEIGDEDYPTEYSPTDTEETESLGESFARAAVEGVSEGWAAFIEEHPDFYPLMWEVLKTKTGELGSKIRGIFTKASVSSPANVPSRSPKPQQSNVVDSPRPSAAKAESRAFPVFRFSSSEYSEMLEDWLKLDYLLANAQIVDDVSPELEAAIRLLRSGGMAQLSESQKLDVFEFLQNQTNNQPDTVLLSGK